MRIRLLISQPDLRAPVSAKTGRNLVSAAEIALAIERAAKLLPGCSCLPKAMAAVTMLAHYGYPSQLRIGLKNDFGDLAAHAWVEFNGNILVGGAVSRREFLALPDIVFQEHSRAN